MLNDFGYLEQIEANLRRVKEEQAANIQAAGKLMADAVEQDRLISVYGGGGATPPVIGARRSAAARRSSFSRRAASRTSTRSWQPSGRCSTRR